MDADLKKRFRSYFNRKLEDEKAGVQTTPPILILDMMAIFKSHFHANDTVTEDGFLVGGVVGVLKSIPQLVHQFKANKVICVFDGEGNSDRRRKIYEGYKANRGNKDKNIRYIHLSVDELKKNEDQQTMAMVSVLKGLPVEIIAVKGLEADDIIGYLTKRYYGNKEGNRIIVSSDKDFLQLIDPHTQFYNIRKKELVSIHNVSDYWDVPIANFVVVRAVEGDISDNIKGVPSVKLKTLIKLLPEIQTTKFLGVDDFWSYIVSQSETLSKSKAGQNLLASEEIIRRNYRLMQLSDPEITTSEEFKILNLLNETKKSTLIEFILVEQFMAKYRLHGVVNVQALKSLFGKLTD